MNSRVMHVLEHGICSLNARGLVPFITDEKMLEMLFRRQLGYRLDLKNPKTFNEKLQWLKLHDRNPLYTTLVDKCAVKDWVAERIGAEYVTETYVRWDRVEDIDISDLPERFVLKTNHDCGGIVICRDRAAFDLGAARRKLAKHLRRNYYWCGREWPYKGVRPCVFAEEYLDPGDSGMTDYKLMCFGGKVHCVFTCTGRSEGDLRVDFFDLDWNRLPFTRHYSNADVPPNAPARLEEMVALSERLAERIPFVRVDFYEVAGELYFGEMTFYPGSGFEEFDPEEWDERLGRCIELPSGGWLLLSDSSVLWLHGVEPIAASRAGLTDYKLYCFGGEPRLLYVSQGLEDHSTARISFLNLDWTFAPFCRDDYKPFDELPQRPRSLDRMIELARALSEGVPFVRVDFFDVGGEPRFSEMTFHPCAGLMPFDPLEWDIELGSWIDLSKAYDSHRS